MITLRDSDRPRQEKPRSETAGEPDAAAAPQESRPINTIQESLAILQRRRLTLVLVFLLTSVLAILAALQIPPVYRSESSILVKFGREFLYRPEVGAITEQQAFSLEEMVNSEVEIIESRDLVEKVVDTIGLETLYPALLEKEDVDRERARRVAIEIFRDKLVVLGVLESSVIRVSFEHGDPDVGAEAINLLVDFFKEKHLEIFSDSRSGYLDEQFQRYKKELAAAEDELESFKQTHRIFQLTTQRDNKLAQIVEFENQLNATRFQLIELHQKRDSLNASGSLEVPEDAPWHPEARSVLLSQRATLDTLLTETEFQLAEIRQRIASQKESDPADGELPVTTDIGQFHSLDSAMLRLLDLRLKERDLLSRFEERYAAVVAVREEIKLVEDFLADREKQIEQLILNKYEDQLAPTVAKKESIETQIARVEAQLFALDRLETKSQIDALTAREGRNVEEIANLEKQVEDLDRQAKRLRILERDVVLADSRYQTYASKLEEARISEYLDQQKQINLRVIERAAPAVKAAGMSKKMMILVCVFVAGVVAVGMAFLVDLARPQ